MEKKIKISLGMAVCMFIIIVLLVIIGVLLYQNIQIQNKILNNVQNLEQQNIIQESDINVSNNQSEETTTKEEIEEIEEEKLDISTDKRTETILMEGLEEEITTQKYISSLGYSMRYDCDRFTVSKFSNEDEDYYQSVYNESEFLTIYFLETSYEEYISELSGDGGSPVEKEKITFNGYEAVFVDDENIQEYFVKGRNGVFIITIYNVNHFNEGAKARIGEMLSTFEIR